MRRWLSRGLWLLAGAGLAVLLFWGVQATRAQAPIPHSVAEGDDCLSCHQTGSGGAPRVSGDHRGRRNTDCQLCHDLTGAAAADIPHPLDGRDNCLSCHLAGFGVAPPLSGGHLSYKNEQCRDCHRPSAKVTEVPTPGTSGQTPTPQPTPTPAPAPSGVGSCATCHQTIFNDQKHAVFTGQPKGDAQAGAKLFAQVCATCHGQNGTTAVGDKKVVINTKEYWSTHDDAAILRGIGIGSHGKMTAFAQGYGGPLTWEEILNLVAFVRTWGALAAPGTPTSTAAGDATNGAKVYAQYCAGCHGDKGQGGAVAQKPLNAREYLASVTDDTLRQTILKGITGMPGFATVVGDKEVTDLIAFLRSWGAPAVSTPTPTPTPISSGDATNGAKVYAQYCAGCHGPDGQGSPAVKKSLHAPEYLASVTDETLRQTIPKGATGMPGFATIIGNKEVTDLIALFRSWQRK